MKSTGQSFRRAIGLALCTSAVAACGGGGGGGPSSAATSGVPAAVSSSVAALVAWASQLPQSDSAEPLSTTSFTPPVSDTAQPTLIML